MYSILPPGSRQKQEELVFVGCRMVAVQELLQVPWAGGARRINTKCDHVPFAAHRAVRKVAGVGVEGRCGWGNWEQAASISVATGALSSSLQVAHDACASGTVPGVSSWSAGCLWAMFDQRLTSV